MSESSSFLHLWLRLLTFRASHADYASLNWRHLLAGLVACWVVGMGRYWDDPRATLLQHLGLGSVMYVIVLAAVLWVIAKPVDPSNISYPGILTMVVMTGPPAALYAIPVERWTTLETANQLNLLFLGIVALWRLSLWIHYLAKVSSLSGGKVTVCAIMPIGLILAALVTLNLHHVIVDVMGGIRQADKSSQDAAYMVMWLLNILALPISAIMGICWLFLAGAGIAEWWQHRKAVRSVRGDSKGP